MTITNEDKKTLDGEGERIAKFLARAGVCSRREAERLIAEGRVTVDGVVLETPAFKATADMDIRVDDARVKTSEPTRVWRYHKPTGLMTTHKDPQGRPTVFESLPGTMPRVISIGRLDLNSEGLLLLTNDGALARHLETPATGWTRRYKVRAYGDFKKKHAEELKAGVVVEDDVFGPIDVKEESRQGANVWLMVSLKEGRNREVRRALSAVGLQVNRLIRTAYGPFQLGKLKANAVEEVPTKTLREQLGKSFDTFNF